MRRLSVLITLILAVLLYMAACDATEEEGTPTTDTIGLVWDEGNWDEANWQ